MAPRKDQPRTDRQEKILEYIKSEVQRRGFPPSVREICDAMGIKSTSTVHGHLRRLELLKPSCKSKYMQSLHLTLSLITFTAVCYNSVGVRAPIYSFKVPFNSLSFVRGLFVSINSVALSTVIVSLIFLIFGQSAQRSASHASAINKLPIFMMPPSLFRMSSRKGRPA